MNCQEYPDAERYEVGRRRKKNFNPNEEKVCLRVGAGDMEVELGDEVKEAHVRVSGGGDIILTGNTEAIQKIEASTDGKIIVEGPLEEFEKRVSTGGKIQIQDS